MPSSIDEKPSANIVRMWRLLAKHHPRGRMLPQHSHCSGQLLFATRGVMLVEADAVNWIVPPQRALWIPPNAEHSLTMLTDADLRTVYFDQKQIEQCPTFHRKNQVHVVAATPLIRELIAALFDDAQSDAHHLIAPLVLSLLTETCDISSRLPMPSDERLRQAISQILIANNWDMPIASVADASAMSERTLSRRFVEDTGMTLRQWKQRSRICASLDLLANGESIKRVALELNFSTPAAFVAAFKSVMGFTPSRLSQQNSREPEMKGTSYRT